MFNSRVWVFHFVICFSGYLQCGKSDVQKLRDSKRIKEDFLFANKNSFDQGNLIFAVCDKNTPSWTECNIIQKIYPNKENTRSCMITLQGNHEESRLNIRIGIATLGRSKAILYWGENYYNTSIAKVGTIDLETCKMNEVTIRDPKKEVLLEMFYTEKMVSYDDESFDIFFNDSELCGEKLCVMTIDKDGTLKSQPTVSKFSGLGFVLHISPIVSRISSDRFVHLTRIGLNYILSIVQSDGTEKILESYDSTARPTITASENVVTACTKANVDIDVNCTQYDETGNVKFTAMIPEEYKNTQSRALCNLPDGGVLVMLAEMTHCDQLLNCDETNYHMVKIAPDGNIIGMVRIEEFNSVTSQWRETYVYKHGDSEYCAVLIGQNPILDEQKLNNYEILYHCVTENEFSD